MAATTNMMQKSYTCVTIVSESFSLNHVVRCNLGKGIDTCTPTLPWLGLAGVALPRLGLGTETKEVQCGH